MGHPDFEAIFRQAAERRQSIAAELAARMFTLNGSPVYFPGNVLMQVLWVYDGAPIDWGEEFYLDNLLADDLAVGGVVEFNGDDPGEVLTIQRVR